jgi:hypothetical protein
MFKDFWNNSGRDNNQECTALLLEAGSGRPACFAGLKACFHEYYLMQSVATAD